MSEEAAPINNGAPSQVPFQFRLVHLLYATSVLAAGMATFGAVGIFCAYGVVTIWALVFAVTKRELSFASASIALLVLFIGACLLMPSFDVGAGYTRRAQCKNNLKYIVIALHAYHEAHGTFPPAYIADAQGKPMHSWRVLILPFLDEQALYEQYNFNEPWNGPSNRKLMASMPDEFACPGHIDRAANSPSATRYVAVVGDETAWPGDEGRIFAEFEGDPHNTILVIEDTGHAIQWLEPRDVTVDEAVQMLAEKESETAGVHRSEGFFYDEVMMERNVAMADGSVPNFGTSISPERIRSLLSIDGSVQLDDLQLEWTRSAVRPRLGNWFRLAVFVVVTLFPLPWVWRKRTASAPSDFAAQPIRQPL